MKLLRLPSGELRLTIVDYAGDALRIESRGELHRKLVLTLVDDEASDVCVDLTPYQLYQLLPHLEAFAARGKLEVPRNGK